MRFRLFTVVFIASALSFSCSPADDSTGSVSLRTDVIDAEDNAVFVQVATEGDWVLDLDFHGGDSWAQLQRTSGTGNSNSIVLTCETNWSRSPRKLTVVAGFPGNTDSAELTQLGAEETLSPDPEYPGLESDPLRSWMELPEMRSEEGCAWVYHDMNIGGNKVVRNYSLFYDAKNMLARWVAYPLNKGLIGSGSRHDQFEAIDPKIPKEYQPYTEKGWGVGGYDRGHQLPAADRYHTYAADKTLDAHRSTFYPTNMTVQNGSFNQGIWADLEGKVRAWSDKCDTLYVVTGCVPSESHFITDRGGNTVNVPEGYFKALLRYTKSSTLGQPYLGIAFYFANEPYSGGSKVNSSMSMTIDALEEQLGMNFFPRLTPEQEAAAEASVHEWWWSN